MGALFNQFGYGSPRPRSLGGLGTGSWNGWEVDDDRSAEFLSLFWSHYQRVYSFFVRKRFRSQEAEELTQDTFMRVFQRMDGYRGGDPVAFLMKVSDSVFKNEIRRRLTVMRNLRVGTLDDTDRPVADNVSDPLFGSAPQTPEEHAAWEESIREIRGVMSELPKRRARYLELYVVGLKYREIAAQHDESLDTVKKEIFLARRFLRERLGARVDTWFDRLPEDDDD